MSELVVSNDSDYRETIAGKELCDKLGRWLTDAYQGYHWRLEPHPHPTHPFVDVRLNSAGAAIESKIGRYGEERLLMKLPGYAVKPWLCYSDSSLKAETLKAGGTLLEMFNFSRRAFKETELLEAKKRLGFLILPTL